MNTPLQLIIRSATGADRFVSLDRALEAGLALAWREQVVGVQDASGAPAANLALRRVGAEWHLWQEEEEAGREVGRIRTRWVSEDPANETNLARAEPSEEPTDRAPADDPDAGGMIDFAPLTTPAPTSAPSALSGAAAWIGASMAGLVVGLGGLAPRIADRVIGPASPDSDTGSGNGSWTDTGSGAPDPGASPEPVLPPAPAPLAGEFTVRVRVFLGEVTDGVVVALHDEAGALLGRSDVVRAEGGIHSVEIPVSVAHTGPILVVLRDANDDAERGANYVDEITGARTDIGAVRALRTLIASGEGVRSADGLFEVVVSPLTELALRLAGRAPLEAGAEPPALPAGLPAAFAEAARALGQLFGLDGGADSLGGLGTVPDVPTPDNTIDTTSAAGRVGLALALFSGMEIGVQRAAAGDAARVAESLERVLGDLMGGLVVGRDEAGAPVLQPQAGAAGEQALARIGSAIDSIRAVRPDHPSIDALEALAQSTGAQLAGAEPVGPGEPEVPGGTDPVVPPPETFIVRTSVFLGEVTGGVTVALYDAGGIQLGRSTEVKQFGAGYFVDVPVPTSHTGAIKVVVRDVNDGEPLIDNYFDEVTGQQADIRTTSALRAMIPAGSGDRSPNAVLPVVVTPITELAMRLAGQGPLTATTPVGGLDQAAQDGILAAGRALGHVLGLSEATAEAGINGIRPQVALPSARIDSTSDAGKIGLMLGLFSGLEAGTTPRAGSTPSGRALDKILDGLGAGLTVVTDSTGRTFLQATPDTAGKTAVAQILNAAEAIRASTPGHANLPALRNLGDRLEQTMTEGVTLPPPGEPVVNTLVRNDNGSLTVRGTAEPGANVSVRMPDGSTVRGHADGLGNFEITSSATTAVRPPERLTIPLPNAGGTLSVLTGTNGRVQVPAVPEIAGTLVAGQTITLKFPGAPLPDGSAGPPVSVSAMVGTDGRFTATDPATVNAATPLTVQGTLSADGRSVVITLPGGHTLTTLLGSDGTFKTQVPAVQGGSGPNDPVQLTLQTGTADGPDVYRGQVSSTGSLPLTTQESVRGASNPQRTVDITLPDGAVLKAPVQDDGTVNTFRVPRISGDTDPGGSINVVMPNGVTLQTTVDENGRFTVDTAVQVTGVPSKDGRTIVLLLPNGLNLPVPLSQDGTFHFNGPPEVRGSTTPGSLVRVDLPEGPVELRAGPDGSFTARQSVSGTGQKVGDTVVIRLPGGVELSVKPAPDGTINTSAPTIRGKLPAEPTDGSQPAPGPGGLRITLADGTILQGSIDASGTLTAPSNQTASGTAPAGGPVTLTLPSGNVLTVPVKGDGTFSDAIQGAVSGGTHPGDRIAITRPDGSLLMATVDGNRGFRVDEDGVVLTGTFDAANNRMILTLPGGSTLTTPVDADGRFTVAGNLQVGGRLPDGATEGSVQVTLPGGATLTDTFAQGDPIAASGTGRPPAADGTAQGALTASGTVVSTEHLQVDLGGGAILTSAPANPSGEVAQPAVPAIVGTRVGQTLTVGLAGSSTPVLVDAGGHFDLPLGTDGSNNPLTARGQIVTPQDQSPYVLITLPQGGVVRAPIDAQGGFAIPEIPLLSGSVRAGGTPALTLTQRDGDVLSGVVDPVTGLMSAATPPGKTILAESGSRSTLSLKLADGSVLHLPVDPNQQVAQLGIPRIEGQTGSAGTPGTVRVTLPDGTLKTVAVDGTTGTFRVDHTLTVGGTRNADGTAITLQLGNGTTVVLPLASDGSFQHAGPPAMAGTAPKDAAGSVRITGPNGEIQTITVSAEGTFTASVPLQISGRLQGDVMEIHLPGGGSVAAPVGPDGQFSSTVPGVAGDTRPGGTVVLTQPDGRVQDARVESDGTLYSDPPPRVAQGTVLAGSPIPIALADGSTLTVAAKNHTDGTFLAQPFPAISGQLDPATDVGRIALALPGGVVGLDLTAGGTFSTTTTVTLQGRPSADGKLYELTLADGTRLNLPIAPDGTIRHDGPPLVDGSAQPSGTLKVTLPDGTIESVTLNASGGFEINHDITVSGVNSRTSVQITLPDGTLFTLPKDPDSGMFGTPGSPGVRGTDPAGNQPGSVRLTLADGDVLQGVIAPDGTFQATDTAVASGQAIQGEPVILRLPDGSTLTTPPSGSDGTFSVSAFPAITGVAKPDGTVVVDVTLPNGSVVSALVGPDGTFSAPVTAGSPASVIQGRINGSTVEVTLPDGARIDLPVQSDGRFHTDGVPAVSGKTAVARDADGSFIPVRSGDPSQVGGVEVRMPDGAVLRARLDPDGQFRATPQDSVRGLIQESDPVEVLLQGPKGSVPLTTRLNAQGELDLMAPMTVAGDLSPADGAGGARIPLADGTVIRAHQGVGGMAVPTIPRLEGTVVAGETTRLSLVTLDGSLVPATATRILVDGQPVARITFADGTTVDTPVDAGGRFETRLPGLSGPASSGAPITVTFPDGQKHPVQPGPGGEFSLTAPAVIVGAMSPDLPVTTQLPDGTEITVTLGARGGLNIDSPLAQPIGDIAVSATSLLGGSTVPQVVDTTRPGLLQDLDTTPPAVPGVPVLTDLIDGRLKITGTAEPGSLVELTLPDDSQVSARVNADGNYTYTTADLQPEGRLQVVARDSSGNTSQPVREALYYPYVNEPPRPTSWSISAEENKPYVLHADNFDFNDENQQPVPDRFKWLLIDSLPDSGRLTFKGQSVVAGLKVSPADLDAGHLVYTPRTGASGQPVDTFRYRVQDDGGTLRGGEDTSRWATISINIDGENDSPRITSDSTQHAGAVVESGIDAQGNPVLGVEQFSGQLRFEDPDVGDTHTWHWTESDGRPLADLATVDGLPPSRKTEYGTLDLNREGLWSFRLDNSAPLVQQLAAGEEQTVTWTVGLEDREAAPVPQAIGITITGTNDPAQITGSTTASTVAQDTARTTAQGTLQVIDPDRGQSRLALDPADATQASIIRDSGNVLGGVLRVDAATGVWVYTRDDKADTLTTILPNATGTERFTVMSHDGTASQELIITIRGAGGDAKILGTTAGSLSEDSPLSTLSGTVHTIGKTEADGFFSTVVVPEQPNSSLRYGSLGITSAGIWTYTANTARLQTLAAGDQVTERYTVENLDGARETVVVTLLGSNDAPVLAHSGALSQTVQASATSPRAAGQFSATDVDQNDTVTWALKGPNYAEFGAFALDQSGAWSFVLNPAAAATRALRAGETQDIQFTVVATDRQGAQADEVLTVRIAGASEAAVITGERSGSTEAGSLLTTTTGKLNVQDADHHASRAGETEAQFLPDGVPLASNALGGALTIDAQGNWTYTRDDTNPRVVGLGRGVTERESFTVTTLDGTQQDVTVTVTGRNEPTEVLIPASLTVLEHEALVVQGLALRDPDTNTTTTTATLTLADPALTLRLGTAIGVVVTGNDTASLKLTGALAAVNAALAAGGGLEVRTPEHWVGSTTLTVRASDGLSTPDEMAAASRSLTLTVSNLPDAPEISSASSQHRGSVLEVGRNAAGNEVPGQATASGQITVRDPDQNERHTWDLLDALGLPVTPVGSVARDTHPLGTLELTDTGAWTFTLNEQAANALTAGETKNLVWNTRVTDRDGLSVQQKISILVTGAEDLAQVSGDFTGATTAGAATTTATGKLTAQDPDLGQNVFLPNQVQSAAGNTLGGTFSLTSTGSWSYLRNDANPALQALHAGETRREDFTVRTADGTAATVAVTVTGQSDPATIGGTATGSTTAQATVGTVQGVLTVRDPDHDQSVFRTEVAANAGNPLGGSLTVDAAGNWSYVRNDTQPALLWLKGGETSQESFTVRSLDGSASQAIQITVTGAAGDARILGEAAGQLDGGAAAGTTVNGTLTTLGQSAGAAVFNTTVESLSTNPIGALSITAAGQWNYAADAARLQALSAGSNRVETFRVSNQDGATRDVVITLAGNNDPVSFVAPPSAYTGTEDTALYLTGLAVQDADTDTARITVTLELDNPLLALRIAAPPSGLSVTGQDTARVVLTGSPALVNEALAANQGVRLQAPANWAGSATLSLRADDGESSAAQLLAETRSVAITFTSVNDAPQISSAAAQHAGAVREVGRDAAGSPIAGQAVASGQLAATDPDPGDTQTWQLLGADNQPITLSGADAANRSTLFTQGMGTVTLSEQGAWRFVLDEAAADLLRAGETRDLVWKARVTDAGGLSATQELRITVTGAEDLAQVAGSFTGTSTARSSAQTTTGTLTVNDPDQGQAAFQTTVTPAPENRLGGSLALTAAGAWTWTRDDANPTLIALRAGETASESFTVRTVDGTARSVQITVTGVNDTATLAGTTTATTTARSATTTATGTFTVADPDRDQSTFSTVVTPAAGNTLGGSLVITPAGAWTYTRNDSNAALQQLSEGATATEAFTVASLDGSATRTLTVTARGVNDAPSHTLPSAAALTLDEDTTLRIQGIAVADVDAGASDVLTVNLSVPDTRGTLRLSGAPALSLSGNDTRALTLTGTLAQINSALATGSSSTLLYTPPPNANGAVALTMTTADGGNGVPVNSRTTTSEATLTVRPVNDGPLLSLSATTPLEYRKGVSVVLPDATLSDLDLAETAGGVITATVSQTLRGGVLVSTTGLGSSNAFGNFTVTGAPSEVKQALDGLTVMPINDVPSTAFTTAPQRVADPGLASQSTLTYTISDGGATGSGGALSAAQSVVLRPVNLVRNADFQLHQSGYDFQNSWYLANDTRASHFDGSYNSSLTSGPYAPSVNGTGVLRLAGNLMGSVIEGLHAARSMLMQLEAGKQYVMAYDIREQPGSSGPNGAELQWKLAGPYGASGPATVNLGPQWATNLSRASGLLIPKEWDNQRIAFTVPTSGQYTLDINAHISADRTDYLIDRVFVGEVAQGPVIGTVSGVSKGVSALYTTSGPPQGANPEGSITLSSLLGERPDQNTTRGVWIGAIPEAHATLRIWYTTDAGSTWHWVSRTGGDVLTGGIGGSDQGLLLLNDANTRLVLDYPVFAATRLTDAFAVRTWTPGAGAGAPTEADAGTGYTVAAGDLYDRDASRAAGVQQGWMSAEALQARLDLVNGPDDPALGMAVSLLTRNDGAVLQTTANAWQVPGKSGDLGSDQVPDVLLSSSTAATVTRFDSATQDAELSLTASFPPTSGDNSPTDRALLATTATGTPLNLSVPGVAPESLVLSGVAMGELIQVSGDSRFAVVSGRPIPKPGPLERIVTSLGQASAVGEDVLTVGGHDAAGLLLGGMRLTGPADTLQAQGSGAGTVGLVDGDTRLDMLMVVNGTAFLGSGDAIQAATLESAPGADRLLTVRLPEAGNPAVETTPEGGVLRLAATDVRHAALVGDMNGDALSEVVYSDGAGKSWLVLGAPNLFGDPTVKNPNLVLDAARELGVAVAPRTGDLGTLVSPIQSAADMNRDGKADIALRVDDDTVVVRYGSTSITAADPSTLPAQGFTVQAAPGHVIDSARGAGDTNGDGFGDLLVGISNAKGGAGAVYLVYGKNQNGVTIDLANFKGSDGLIYRGAPGERLGVDAAGVGFINPDGLADIVLTTGGAAGGTSGKQYLIYGDQDNNYPGYVAQSVGNATGSLASLGGVLWAGDGKAPYAGWVKIATETSYFQGAGADTLFTEFTPGSSRVFNGGNGFQDRILLNSSPQIDLSTPEAVGRYSDYEHITWQGSGAGGRHPLTPEAVLSLTGGTGLLTVSATGSAYDRGVIMGPARGEVTGTDANGNVVSTSSVVYQPGLANTWYVSSTPEYAGFNGLTYFDRYGQSTGITVVLHGLDGNGVSAF